MEVSISYGANAFYQRNKMRKNKTATAQTLFSFPEKNA